MVTDQRSWQRSITWHSQEEALLFYTNSIYGRHWQGQTDQVLDRHIHLIEKPCELQEPSGLGAWSS